MKYFVSFFMVFVLLSSLSIKVSAEEEITVSVGEWAPYVSEDYKNYGVVPHIVSEAFALGGIKVNYVWAKWKRAYEGVKSGTWDASPTWLATDERRAEVEFNDIPIFELSRVFYHLKSSPLDWQSLGDVKDHSIGAVNGYTYGKEFDDAAKDKKIKVVHATSEDTNFKKLARNRLDLVISNPLTGYSVAKQHLSPEEFEQ